MNDFLRKIKLIDNLTITLQISRKAFVERLSAIVDEGGTGMFSDPFDVFSSSKNEFKGEINFDSFKIKKRKRFFDTNKSLAVADGKISESNAQLTVETEISGFNNFFLGFYIVLSVFYIILIIIFCIISCNSNNISFLFVIPCILLHAALMFSIPYFLMRRSVKRLKYQLEREFFYLTKD